ncbi:MAG: chemotactic signal-response protein chel [Inquilinus sp.]|nr:chemotactic signal-response protein chel [Inquilinus sp.]
MTSLPAANALLAGQPLSATAEAPRATMDPVAARAAADEFEAVFLSQMLSHMVSGIATDGPFGGGQAEEVYRSLLVNEYGRLAAAGGGIGIADQVMAEILRTQEVER